MYNLTQPPPHVIHFDLQTWEANQTAITRDGSLYETNMTNYPEYADGLTWGLKLLNHNYNMPMAENVTFPPPGSSFKLEIIWKDHGKADGSSSYSFIFRSSGIGGFWIQRITTKIQMFLLKEDNASVLFKPLHRAFYNDSPQDLFYNDTPQSI
jgi:hypothetical protein